MSTSCFSFFPFILAVLFGLSLSLFLFLRNWRVSSRHTNALAMQLRSSFHSDLLTGLLFVCSLHLSIRLVVFSFQLVLLSFFHRLSLFHSFAFPPAIFFSRNPMALPFFAPVSLSLPFLSPASHIPSLISSFLVSLLCLLKASPLDDCNAGAGSIRQRARNAYLRWRR